MSRSLLRSRDLDDEVVGLVGIAGLHSHCRSIGCHSSHLDSRYGPRSIRHLGDTDWRRRHCSSHWVGVSDCRCRKKTLYSRLIIVTFATLLLTMLIVVLIVVLVVVAVLLIVGIVGMLAVAIIVMTLRMTRHDGWLLGCPRSALILTKSVLF